MDRRRFLLQASAAASVAACLPLGRSQSGPAVSAELALHEDPEAQLIPLTYAGLSYELAELTNPKFFSPSNRDLIAHFRLLSPQGVLRIGGNTLEACWFQADASTPALEMKLPPDKMDDIWMSHRLFAITPEAIDALAGFLSATGWKLIYGLNLGNSTPERAATEAAYVASAVGNRLLLFQIGNEPDLYHNAGNGNRPPNWGFDDYLKEWIVYAEAIVAKVPEARFGGADCGFNWAMRLGKEVPATLASHVAALTTHTYAEGPPNDPRVTIERLLAGKPSIPTQTKEIVAAARAQGRTYLMSECNTCYRSGKPGLSNAFASALWACDFMLQLASLGCAGVYLHGGSSEFLIAGIGDHTPGLDVAKGPQITLGAYYSPILSEPGRAIKAMPAFYGMLLANQFAGGTPLDVEGNLQGVNATAYAAKTDHGLKVAVFNKDELKTIELSISAPRKVRAATAWRMRAPQLDSTEGVTLAGAEIHAHAQWSPKVVEPVEVRNGIARIRIPAASAALLFLS
jgi:hypothetical protein